MIVPSPDNPEVVFIDQPAARVMPLRVVIPSGLSSREVRLTHHCHDRACEYGYTHWIQPHTADGWWVFRVVSRQESATGRQFLKRFDTRVAAEMWVLHNEQ